eukprot:gnl/MRDRNA2_/MRDRNA2_165489_c0_seq1.p1 gnl/MRDRNA2_/MRDRNA2_165489_c0~~gnl/MRDRNA2_/MRDRNA2_165489_c0_seq1.p1  ORF type:complete len:601 (+),score=70.25 gnl/MRDRNA2_/MRDRNA2_165489_c0_seq1:156-1805(+)
MPIVRGPPRCETTLQKRGKMRLMESFTKVNLWNLSDFRTVVYLDSDMLVLRSVDEIFSKMRCVAGQDVIGLVPTGCGMCVDGDWEDFQSKVGGNTGLMAIRPSLHFTKLFMHALNKDRSWWCGSGEQHLLNDLFTRIFSNAPSAQHQGLCMPTMYNCNCANCLKSADMHASILHWSGESKPWYENTSRHEWGVELWHSFWHEAQNVLTGSGDAIQPNALVLHAATTTNFNAEGSIVNTTTTTTFTMRSAMGAAYNSDVPTPLEQGQDSACDIKDSFRQDDEAFAFLLYGRQSKPLFECCPGLVTVIFSLRKAGTSRHILLLVTDEAIKSDLAVAKLRIEVIVVPLINGPAWCAGTLRNRNKTRLMASFTKVHLWSLVKFRTILYLDSDMLVLQPIDELFTKFRCVKGTELIGLVPTGCGTCSNGDYHHFQDKVGGNTGLMLIRPSADFVNLFMKVKEEKSWWCGSGEQHLLNHLFTRVFAESGSKGNHGFCLPKKYNCNCVACLKSANAKASILHWSGEKKPWNDPPDASGYGSTLWRSYWQLAKQTLS